MVYLRYNKLAADAGVTYAKMPVAITTWPFGVKPPDLSLIANVRGVDWLYTFLHSFYQDASRRRGVITYSFRISDAQYVGGIPGTASCSNRCHGVRKNLSKAYLDTVHWYDALVLQHPGSMNAQEFDATLADVVNFLAYAAEPFHNDQVRIGRWVIGFLLILFVLAYLLKQNYWRDVK